jgi:hypothetical protein
LGKPATSIHVEPPLHGGTYRILDDHEYTLQDITANLSECFRVLGIQATYVENPASAFLLTPEQVEMRISLWKTGTAGNQIRIELQRRQGDSHTFGVYARHILESASADFDLTEYDYRLDLRYLEWAENLLSPGLTDDPKQGQEALMMIERVAGLISVDSVDARIRGMRSSLCLHKSKENKLEEVTYDESSSSLRRRGGHGPSHT